MTDQQEELDAVLDIETMGTRPGSVILSVGMLLFDRNKTDSFEKLRSSGVHFCFNTKVQVDEGLEIDPRTMQWWNKQGEGARAVLNPPEHEQVHPRDFYTAIEKIGTPYSLDKCRWYARGPTFDMVLLETMLAKFNVSAPWKYWAVRDSRTVYDEQGIDYKDIDMPETAIAHNALDDAAWDAWMLQRAKNYGGAAGMIVDRDREIELAGVDR